MEVMVSALLITVGLGSILAINARTVHTLRATRQAAVASQILQQRVETLRDKPWPQIASAAALAHTMATPTESESELAEGKVDEVLNISPAVPSATGPAKGAHSFQVRRKDGAVQIEQDDDLSKEATLLVSSSVTWKDPSGVHQRSLRTIICRAGLTRSGIFGSGLGRPTTTAAP
jgi:Tfp pilus assembly protein PilV